MRLTRSLIPLLVLISAATAMGRTQEPVTSVQSLRPVGETRVWTFEQRDVVLGTLRSSTATGERISDSASVLLEQSLNLDFTLTGGATKLTAEARHFVSPAGWFLGDVLEVPIEGGEERLEVFRDGNVLNVATVRLGGKETSTTPIDRPYRAYEPYFIDLLELYLASQFLSVGQVIIDTLYSPRSLQTVPIALNVQEFSNRRLFNQVIESVFVISMAQPVTAQLLYTPDRRLAKVDFVDINMQVYLDEISGKKTAETAVSRPKQESLPIPLPRLVTAIGSLPHGVVYLLVGLIGALMLGARIGRKDAWLALLAGAILYAATFIPQLKAQAWLMKTVLAPSLASGTSLYAIAILPALLLAVMQELLKAGALFSLTRFFTLPGGIGYGRGAAFGAGFGFLEAFLATASFGVVPLFSGTLAERAFMTLLHTSLGALLGSRVGGGRSGLAPILIVTILINAVVRYFPIFVQSKIIDVAFAQLLLGAVALALLVVVLLTRKRAT